MAVCSVVCDFEGRRRPVSFPSSELDSAKEAHEKLFFAVKNVFSDIISWREEDSYFLQIDSKKHGLIDVVGCPEPVEEGQTVFLRYWRIPEDHVSKPSEKAKSLCTSLGKPSQANAKVLASLFPACRSSALAKKPSAKKFDPFDECVASESHQRKKATTGKRAKRVNVVMLKRIPSRVPKGIHRNRLREDGRIIELAFYRSMTSKETMKLIIESFKSVDGVKKLQFLQANRDNTLQVHVEQELDGNSVLNLAGCGSLYVQQMEECDEELNDEGVETPSSSSAVRRKQLLQRADELIQELRTPPAETSKNLPEIISSDESEMDNSDTTFDLMESRRIRDEQDRAFEECLEADRAKEEEKRKQLEIEEGDKRKETLWLQNLSGLRMKLKAKFQHPTVSGVKVGFKLPDGTPTHFSFSCCCTLKDLYQYVVSKDVVPPFSLYTPHPRCLLSLSQESAILYDETLIIVASEDESYDQTVLDVLSDEKIEDEAMSSSESSEGDQERILFVHTTTGFVPGLERIVDRENLYNDVLSMYKEGDIVCEYPLFVKYKGENALDDGGVQRDMFSAFWGDAYINLFEGAKTLVPMVQPGIDIANFSTLGRIISHGYLACGFLPVRIVLPSLISMVLGPSVMIPPSILIESFSEYVSEVERLKIKAALACSLPFSPSVAEDLVNILSRFGCRQIPTYLNLPKLIEDVARYEFCVKPAAALALIHAGIPANHRLFWQKKSACDVHDLFYAMTVTPTKVLALLELPSANNENESRMFGYLTTMIGNMKTTELSLFLRFVTGASVCIVPKITVEFNGLDGFARRPIAHTCDSVLELPTSYINYDEFYSEFQLILNETMKTFAW